MMDFATVLKDVLKVIGCGIIMLIILVFALGLFLGRL